MCIAFLKCHSRLFSFKSGGVKVCVDRYGMFGPNADTDNMEKEQSNVQYIGQNYKYGY